MIQLISSFLRKCFFLPRIRKNPLLPTAEVSEPTKPSSTADDNPYSEGISLVQTFESNRTSNLVQVINQSNLAKVPDRFHPEGVKTMNSLEVSLNRSDSPPRELTEMGEERSERPVVWLAAKASSIQVKIQNAYDQAVDLIDEARQVQSKIMDAYGQAVELIGEARQVQSKIMDAYDQAVELIGQARHVKSKIMDAHTQALGLAAEASQIQFNVLKSSLNVEGNLFPNQIQCLNNQLLTNLTKDEESFKSNLNNKQVELDQTVLSLAQHLSSLSYSYHQEAKPVLLVEDKPELPIDAKPLLPAVAKPELAIEDKPELPLEAKPELAVEAKPELPVEKKPVSVKRAYRKTSTSAKGTKDAHINLNQSLSGLDNLSPTSKQQIKSRVKIEPIKEKPARSNRSTKKA
jgi:hypothetical protein